MTEKFRPLRFLGKIFVYLLFACYLFVGTSAAWQVFKAAMNKRQDITALSALIEKSIQTDNLEDVTAWVRFRPLAETEALTATLTPVSGGLDPSIFLELARRQRMLKNTEEALFWVQLGRFRLRFDALRCGSPDSYKTLDKITALVTPEDVSELLQKHPELVKASVRRVLDFDKKYPARNNPSYICNVLNKLERGNVAAVPKEHWEAIRQSLRAGAETFVKEPGKKK